MKIEINEDGTVTIDGNVYAPLIKADYPVTEPLHPTIDEIYDSVKPMHWNRFNGGLVKMSKYDDLNKKISKTNIPTKEDAEYILATMQLINIASYYNAKFPN